MSYQTSSFAYEACKYGLSTNLLYPSNSKTEIRVKDQGSFKKTWELIKDEALKSERNKSAFHKILKPVRFVARAIYFSVVFSVFGGVGSVYHLTSTVLFSAKFVVKKNQ